MTTQATNPIVALSALRNASRSDKALGIEEALKYGGVRKASDIVNTSFSSSKNLFMASDNVQKNLIALGATGDPLLNGTSLITGVMEQVTPYIQMTTVRELFPEAEYASQRLLLDIFDPITGMTHNTALDEPVPVIQKRGIVTEEFQPATSQEVLEISQEEILFLRNPGDQNISVRGLATYMAMWSEQLSHRGLVKQLNDIYTALFTNQYTWKNKVISYGIPGGNTIDTSALSGNWGTITASNITPNPLANPILDLSIILNNILKMYRGLKMKLIMNYNTNQLICQNPNVISRVPFIYANNSLVSPAMTGGVTADTLLKYFLGGDLGVEVIIDNSTYIADVNDPNGYSAGAVNPILPNYMIWVYIDTDGFGKPLGEYAYTLAVQNGGTANPKAGKYFYLVDTSISQTIDGISQPRIFLGHGWNGSPRIMRPNDIWHIYVGS
jgi:hypothetical protein